MKTLRIVILEEDSDTPAALRAGGYGGLDLRMLEGLSGTDVATLLRERAMPAPFVDTSTDNLTPLSSGYGAQSDLEHELRSALQSQAGHTMTLLLGSSEPQTERTTPGNGGNLPFERLNASLMRALRRHELEAALTESETRTRRLGLADRLTGLPSRELFLDRLEQAASAVMRGGYSFAILMIGFEWPGNLPDGLSASSADSLIETLARRLIRCGRRSDSYARIGGHSFAALLLGNNSVGGSTAMAHKIAEQLALPMMVDGRSMDPGVSVGVALCPQHGTDGRSMLLHAQAAMEQAQQSRRPVAVYDPRHPRSNHSPAALHADAASMAPGDEALAPLLAEALERRQLTLAYQPVVDLRAGPDGALDWTLRRLETLARWHHPVHGHIAPSVFIPVAEHHALIGQLTDQLLGQALSTAAPWRSQGLVPAVSINISGRLLEDPDLPARIQAALQLHKWPGEALVLELAASVLAQPSVQAQGVLAQLGQLGVRLVVDDFGIGLGSYLALADLGSLAELKVDLRSLRQSSGSVRSDRGAAVLRSLITLAQGLGAEVVAKGVEDAGTAAWLLQLGCHAAQGYAWSRALPPEQVRAWCAAQAATRRLKH